MFLHYLIKLLIYRNDNIRYAKFYAANAGKGRKERNPTFQIFDKEEKKFVEMSIKPTDYYLMKKYFTKYNVMIYMIISKSLYDFRNKNFF